MPRAVRTQFIVELHGEAARSSSGQIRATAILGLVVGLHVATGQTEGKTSGQGPNHSVRFPLELAYLNFGLVY